ncbi:MAG: aminotransferase class III-fold pyridoxal phosphate-dependent enzyme [Gammaproteobacteria bacterium]|nr:aminotransferase class III-fold pyridoxal phosphate-dependent enzyme [Gammaproteobacteria bacterium]MDH3363228.1 aminotransferase class III-fold pyridoxal phosphate-dependent enzyme [Gammaproteobacteria bacterium]MDH3482343.1 aminotransferase class III-fold pyridoxal phosphate-dependent enzyme [Gammaproteobacteria bacterium]
MSIAQQQAAADPRVREAAAMIPVYGQLPFVPERASGCDIFTTDGRRILDLYGGHAVAALGYGHPRLVEAIQEQNSKLLFQSNAVALEIRARAAENLVRIAPKGLDRVFFVNSGAEANENALRMACVTTGRKKILAITQGFHGRTAAAGAVTWNAEKWYGFPSKPFDVDFIPRDDITAARAMITGAVAGVIVEPVQGVAGAYDLSTDFLDTLRKETREYGAVLIADEVQSGMGRCGQYFGVQVHGIVPDIITSAKSLGGGVPCGAVVCSHEIAARFGPGDLGTTFGGGPLAAAAITATIEAIDAEGLLDNVRQREAQIREQCVIGPVKKIQGMGLLLGLVCDRPAKEVQSALLEHDIFAGTSSDPDVLRILAPLVLERRHVDHLAQALENMAPLTRSTD